MKSNRLAALLIALALLLQMGPFAVLPVHAVEPMTLTVDSVEAKPGETVTVAVALSNNTGFAGFTLKVSYDTSAMKLTKIKQGEVLNAVDASGLSSNVSVGVANWASTTNATRNGEMMTMTFTVNADASSGAYGVTLTVDDFFSVDDNGRFSDCTTQIEAGTVSVAADVHVHEFTTETVNPTCKENGSQTSTCSICGYSETVALPALGHSYENGICSACGDTLGIIKHKQWTMSLDSVAFLNYYVNLTGFADDVDFAKQGGVVIWTGNVAPTKANQLQVGLENCKTIEGMFKNDNGWYVRSHEIFAKNLGDMVYMRPYVEVSEGVYVYGPAKGYSPHRYCLDMVGNENERLDTRRLCAALLEYGAAAQLYFDHNEDNLVNMGMNLQEEYNLVYDKSYLNSLNVTDHARSLVSTLDGVKKGVSYKKATLNLQGAIRMSVGYNIDASIIDWNQVEKAEVLFWTEDRIAGIDSLAYELHNYTYSHELRPKNAEDTVELGDYRSISDHIQAKDLGKTMFYCCRIVMKDGTVYRSGLNAYSPEAFLGDHLKTATGEIGDLCQKIAVYGEMARLRFS